jgi:hypothetical protein
MSATMTRPGPELFRVERLDGRSNQRVVIDLVAGADPGTTFGYDQLAAALGDGTTRDFDRRAVQEIVRAANLRLLREHQRCLRSVPNVGYRLAFARDHMELAGDRNRRGRRQYKRAVETLENVRMDEMTEQERAIHLAQQAINAELYHAIRRVSRRVAERDDVIARLVKDVDQLKAAG